MPTDIVFIHSGLGNQMFQYAFYLSRKAINPNSKCDMGLLLKRKVHNGFELNRIFDLKIGSNPFHILLIRTSYYSNFIKQLLKKININIISDTNHTVKSKNINYFLGYWQSENYFSHMREEIRRVFLFPKNNLSEKTKELEKIINCNNSVSIHIRRGDYTTNENIKLYGNICTLEYYKNAISIINKKVNSPRYFVFSNDIEWCKNNLNIPSPIYVDHNIGNNSWQDMFLMSQCKHNIIANSTFSWWGAWLNSNPEKIIICPTKLDNVNSSPDIFPDSWIKI